MTDLMCSANSFLILRADSGRRTQAMNLEGRRSGTSSAGVEEPDVGGRKGDLGRERSWSEERIPERIAIPIVPRGVG